VTMIELRTIILFVCVAYSEERMSLGQSRAELKYAFRNLSVGRPSSCWHLKGVDSQVLVRPVITETTGSLNSKKASFALTGEDAFFFPEPTTTQRLTWPLTSFVSAMLLLPILGE